MIEEVVTALVSGFSTFLVGIGTGALEFLEVIFWDPTAGAGTGALTTFGLVIILFMGIGVSYYIIGLVRSTIKG